MAKSHPAPLLQTTGNKPVQTFRHRSIKASIWKNQTANGLMYDVKIVRSYKEKDTETWHDTHSFRYDDLLVVAKLMYDCHSFISAQRTKDGLANRGGKRRESATS